MTDIDYSQSIEVPLLNADNTIHSSKTNLDLKLSQIETLLTGNNTYELQTSPNYSQQLDRIEGVFISIFDPLKGNEIYFTYPQDSELENVEYLSLPSGLHKIPNDIIYFKVGENYGACIYQRLPASSDRFKVRGYEMRSVGLIANNYLTLNVRIQQLKDKIRLNAPLDQLSDELTQFYQIPPNLSSYSDSQMNDDILNSPGINPSSPSSHPIQVMNPVLQLQQMIYQFGAQWTILWKFILLRRRILIYCSPPLQSQCALVWNLSFLTDIVSDLFNAEPYEILFNIGVNELDQLQRIESYIAVTSDRLILEKKDRYDLVIEFGEDTHRPPTLRAHPKDVKLLVLNANDLYTYRALVDTMKSDQLSENGKSMDILKQFVNFWYFKSEKLMNQIDHHLRSLEAASHVNGGGHSRPLNRWTRQLSIDGVQLDHFGLHGYLDTYFVSQLVTMYFSGYYSVAVTGSYWKYQFVNDLYQRKGLAIAGGLAIVITVIVASLFISKSF